MRSLLFLFICISSISWCSAQGLEQLIAEKIPAKVQLIALGDPSHQESTITSSRIDLIKYLIEERGFTTIAFEANILEVHRAFLQFKKTGQISDLEEAMYAQSNLQEMELLYEYVNEKIKEGHPIRLIGFDVRSSGTHYAELHYHEVKNLNLLNEEELKAFKRLLQKSEEVGLVNLFRNKKKIKEELLSLTKKVIAHYKPQNKNEAIFFQSLRNIAYLYQATDTVAIEKRDQAMFTNIEFILNLYPNEKIILFGSSTHFQKNSKAILSDFHQTHPPLLGEYLSAAYGARYFFIAYTALSGTQWVYPNKEKRLPPAEAGSIEYQLIGEKGLTTQIYTPTTSNTSSPIASRFLGHYFYSIADLSKVMDLLVAIPESQAAEIKKR